MKSNNESSRIENGIFFDSLDEPTPVAKPGEQDPPIPPTKGIDESNVE